MPATPVYQLPYPAAADPADVPLDLQELAARIEVAIAPGSATGQVLVWNQTAKVWAAQAKAPDAEALDGTDSSGFLQTLVSGKRFWGGNPTVTVDGAGHAVIGHPLGVMPVWAHAQPDQATGLGGKSVLSVGASAAALNVFMPDAGNITGKLWVAAVG